MVKRKTKRKATKKRTSAKKLNVKPRRKFNNKIYYLTKKITNTKKEAMKEMKTLKKKGVKDVKAVKRIVGSRTIYLIYVRFF